MRVSTDNIGLARVADGLELVRIGEPLRPELAAWRYGDQFGRRQRRTGAYTGLAVVASVGIVFIGPAIGGAAGLSWAGYHFLNAAVDVYQQRRVRARLTIPGRDHPIAVRSNQIKRLSLASTDNTWALRVSFEEQDDGSPPVFGRLWMRERSISSVLLTGDDALRAAARLLPSVNAAGANRREVAKAVDLLSETPDPSRLFAKYAAETPTEQYLSYLSRPVRLALEMASHEDTERRALEGELHLLESAWREAEEIAAIADGLLLPAETDDRFDALKREVDEG